MRHSFGGESSMQRGIFAFREVHTAMGDVQVISTKYITTEFRI